MSSPGGRFELGSLDPAASLDDLEPLLEVVGDARVVGVGESNHDVREFGWLRHRVARLLVERAGFDVVALESGFAEALELGEWVRGGGEAVADVAPRALGYRFGEAGEVQDLLSWVRSLDGAVGFAGVDVPGSGGNADRAWPLIEGVLREVDEGAVALVAEAREAVSRYSAVHSGLAMGRYAELGTAERDAVTGAVSALLTCVEGLGPVVPVEVRARWAVALHVARGVWRLDGFMRELVALGAGRGRLMSRDVHMAESVRWLLERGSRVVVLAHNGHVQRTPVPFAGMPSPMVPMGMFLAAELGADYRVVGVTCGGGTTAGVSMDASAPGGLRLHESPLPSPAADSVEAWLAGSGAVGVDVRGSSGGPRSIRHVDSFVRTPVFEAFDAVLQVPRVRPSDFVLAESGLGR